MANIELVIKLPQEKYNMIKRNMYCGIYDANLYNAIANGIPLPKGHGDLIDRQSLIDNGINKEFCDWYEIKYADTIIEADKEESEVEK